MKFKFDLNRYLAEKAKREEEELWMKQFKGEGLYPIIFGENNEFKMWLK